MNRMVRCNRSQWDLKLELVSLRTRIVLFHLSHHYCFESLSGTSRKKTGFSFFLFRSKLLAGQSLASDQTEASNCRHYFIKLIGRTITDGPLSCSSFFILPASVPICRRTQLLRHARRPASRRPKFSWKLFRK